MLRPLPKLQQLAELGAVLCLCRTDADSDLAGWSQAICASYGCELDSDGLREQIRFYDAAGNCCWRLCLLPDTDFLAWERLAAELPCVPAGMAVPGIAERLWRHLARRLLEPGWRACALRFHARGGPGEAAALAASLPALSDLGCVQAQRIMRCEGIEQTALQAGWPRVLGSAA